MAQLLIPRFLPKFRKQFKKLHPILQRKFTKQLTFLITNPRHRSLRARKMEGSDLFEARLDYHNRFVYRVVGNEICFYTIGPHDEGLGKK